MKIINCYRSCCSFCFSLALMLPKFYKSFFSLVFRNFFYSFVSLFSSFPLMSHPRDRPLSLSFSFTPTCSFIFVSVDFFRSIFLWLGNLSLRNYFLICLGLVLIAYSSSVSFLNEARSEKWQKSSRGSCSWRTRCCTLCHRACTSVLALLVGSSIATLALPRLFLILLFFIPHRRCLDSIAPSSGWRLFEILPASLFSASSYLWLLTSRTRTYYDRWHRWRAREWERTRIRRIIAMHLVHTAEQDATGHCLHFVLPFLATYSSRRQRYIIAKPQFFRS